MSGILSRFVGGVDENGIVSITKLLSYDVVGDPGVINAVLEKKIPVNKSRYNPHPDIDPYGEENWEEL